MLANNQGAIALAKNPHLYEQSRHIDISYYYIWDLVKQEKVKVKYIPIVKMTADSFTKPLERVAFKKFKDQLGIISKS